MIVLMRGFKFKKQILRIACTFHQHFKPKFTDPDSYLINILFQDGGMPYLFKMKILPFFRTLPVDLTDMCRRLLYFSEVISVMKIIK